MSFGNLTQLQRYKNLIKFIDQNFKEDINIEKIEKVSFYSYRNINRIFQSLHNETVGKYIKRIRLEKAAEYLKYSNLQISKIAIDIGFSDVAAFSKSFKKKFLCSPLTFRQNTQIINRVNKQTSSKKNSIPFEIETLPEFKLLYLEYLGNYENIVAIEKTWDKLIMYCDKQKLITQETSFFSETLDDNTITDDFNCRTNVAITLNELSNFVPEGLFRIRKHKTQKYAKFIHKGANEKLVETYNQIYSTWMSEVQLEFEDKPTLEFYVNHHNKTLKKNLITEIYIPVK